MCGACGTGVSTAPWEVHAHGASPRHHRQRAAEATALAGGRLHIQPFGPAGYVIAARTGARQVVRDVDALAREMIKRQGDTVIARAAEVIQDRAATPVAFAVLDQTA